MFKKINFFYTIFVILGIVLIVLLFLFTLNNNINLFYSPYEIYQGNVSCKKKIRVGGVVKNGSIKYEDNSKVSFYITDYKYDIKVVYSGCLPDLFREHQGVVALGYLDELYVFNAEQILAKHDENYIPFDIKH